MPDDDKPDDPMALILAELRSLNRTLRMLASHLMAVSEEPLGVPAMPDVLPRRLPEPLERCLRAMEPERREQLLGELRRAWTGG
jgi:hypothetical protein